MGRVGAVPSNDVTIIIFPVRQMNEAIGDQVVGPEIGGMSVVTSSWSRVF